jgi:hypothetical protein
LLAIYGKAFHPSEKLKGFDRWVSLFEVFFIISLFLWRRNWQMWVTTAVIFCSWAGYSIFWFMIKLPCACMGTLIPHVSLFSFFIDLIFVILSFCIAFFLQTKHYILYFWMVLGAVFFLTGYAFAEKIYKNFILS